MVEEVEGEFVVKWVSFVALNHWSGSLFNCCATTLLKKKFYEIKIVPLFLVRDVSSIRIHLAFPTFVKPFVFLDIDQFSSEATSNKKKYKKTSIHVKKREPFNARLVAQEKDHICCPTLNAFTWWWYQNSNYCTFQVGYD